MKPHLTTANAEPRTHGPGLLCVAHSCEDQSMTFDLGAVLSAFITAGLAAAATLATAMSPSSRRVSRLERLVAARERVDEPVTAQRLDYAIKSLSYQIAEDAAHLGNRAGSRILGFSVLTMAAGVFQLVYLAITGQDDWTWAGWMGLVLFGLGWVAVLISLTAVPEITEKRVKKDLSPPPPAPPAG